MISENSYQFYAFQKLESDQFSVNILYLTSVLMIERLFQSFSINVFEVLLIFTHDIMYKNNKIDRFFAGALTLSTAKSSGYCILMKSIHSRK